MCRPSWSLGALGATLRRSCCRRRVSGSASRPGCRCRVWSPWRSWCWARGVGQAAATPERSRRCPREDHDAAFCGGSGPEGPSVGLGSARGEDDLVAHGGEPVARARSSSSGTADRPGEDRFAHAPPIFDAHAGSESVPSSKRTEGDVAAGPAGAPVTPPRARRARPAPSTAPSARSLAPRCATRKREPMVLAQEVVQRFCAGFQRPVVVPARSGSRKVAASACAIPRSVGSPTSAAALA